MSRRVFAIVTTILVLTASPAVHRGQEPRSDRPARAQRREGVRRLGGLALDRLGELLGGTAEDSPPLDVEKLNRAAADIAAGLEGAGTDLQGIKFRLDADGTNLAEDRLRFAATLNLRRTFWSADPTEVQLELDVHLERSESVRAIVEGRLVVATDVVALAREALPKLQQRLESPPADDLSPAELSIRERTLAKLERTPPPANLDDLADLILYLSIERIGAWTEEIERLAQERDAATRDSTTAEAATHDAQRDVLEEELAAARLGRDKLFGTRPRLYRDDLGRLDSFAVGFGDGELTGAVQSQALELRIWPDELLVEGGAAVHGLEWYPLVKPFVLKTLAQIQDRDPDTMETAERFGGRLLRFLETDDWPEAE